MGRLRLMCRKELKIMLLPPSLTQWWNSLEQLEMGTAEGVGGLSWRSTARARRSACRRHSRAKGIGRRDRRKAATTGRKRAHWEERAPGYKSLPGLWQLMLSWASGFSPQPQYCPEIETVVLRRSLGQWEDGGCSVWGGGVCSCN